MFSENTLNLLPTKALASLSNGKTAEAMNKSSELSAKKARAQKLDGYDEVPTTNQGRTTVELKNVKHAQEANSEQTTGATSAGKLAGVLAQGGMPVFAAGSLAKGTKSGPADIEAMNVELGDEAAKTADAEWTSETLDYQKQAIQIDIANKRQELDEVRQDLDQINNIIERRGLPTDDPRALPDPVLLVGDIETALTNIIDGYAISGIPGVGIPLDPSALEILRDGLTSQMDKDITQFEKFVTDRIIIPYSENEAAMDIIVAQIKGVQVTPSEDIFRTIFAPPVSYAGKFILSQDGLYYDSRTGSIPTIVSQKIDAASWQLRYASNKGGKGELYAPNQVSRLANTIFDDEYQNESGDVLKFYEFDDVLRALLNDRNLQIMDASAKIDDLVASGYSEDSALIQNYKESYGAIAYAYDSKIKKRKKQLQVAALFGPYGITDTKSIIGEGVFYRELDKPGKVIPPEVCRVTSPAVPPPSSPSSIEYIDRIPVNDFTYLKDISLVPSIQMQKSAMLHSSDLDDTTLPFKPASAKFITSGVPQNVDGIPEMSVPDYGITDWITTSGDTDLTGTAPYLRTLESSIVKPGLVACYNFLEPSAVVSPSSDVYGVKNYSETGAALDAKLVGAHASAIFVSGVTIPYLTGSLYDATSKYGLKYAAIPKGSYVRLPNNFRNNKPYPPSQPLDNLMYNENGWSFDFWAHVPDVSSSLTYDHRYKLIAANENCGSGFYGGMYHGGNPRTTAQLSGIIQGQRDRRTLGMVIGFRDKGYPGTDGASGLEFVILPTVSQNSERWGKSICIAESVSGDGGGPTCRTELGVKIPITTTTVSGYTIGSCSAAFTHYAIACDLSSDTITVYVNGQFIASALASTSFQRYPGRPINIPTAATKGHFHDNTGKNGERLYTGAFPSIPIFTPWILGGGFTDGIAHEVPPIFKTETFPGFLGVNTNDDYFRVAMAPLPGGPVGQHTRLDPPADDAVPGLGGYTATGATLKIPRSGLDGYLGSFKIYNVGLTSNAVQVNYKAQKPFFTGIQVNAAGEPRIL